MNEVFIIVAGWIIQDGNYPDFRVGENRDFALQLYGISLKPSKMRLKSAQYLNRGNYQICGEIIYCKKDTVVIDFGFLAYQYDVGEKHLPDWVQSHNLKKGDWVEGEISLGIDPFFYFYFLIKRRNIPKLTYSFLIKQVFLDTSPLVLAGECYVSDKSRESFQEREKTDAWKDSAGGIESPMPFTPTYLFKCIFLEK